MGESNNPFIDQTYDVETSHKYTQISADVLRAYPYKTLNRLLDDIKWALPFRVHCANQSILKLKPLVYADQLARLVRSKTVQPQMLMLNNDLPHFKSKQVISLNDNNENQSLTILRGLVIVGGAAPQVNHFKIQVLENKSAFFSLGHMVDKYEYHVIPSSLISPDDMKQFAVSSEQSGNLVDEVYLCSANSDQSQLLRIGVYGPEFDDSDVDSMADTTIIKERYVKEAQSLNLDPTTVPLPLQCIQKLINVLKGPLTLDPSEQVKTVNLATTSLASMVDIQMILTKLNFACVDNKLVPPSLAQYPELRESYLRKVVELIYIGKSIRSPNNEFNTIYSFSDSLSQIYGTFNEFDKQLCQTFGLYHNSNEYPAFIALSCCIFFLEESTIKCFEITMRSDPEGTLYYVDHFKTIIQVREKSTKLKAYLNQRKSLLGFTDYVRSLNDIGIQTSNETPKQLLEIDDDYITSIYETSVKSDFRNYPFFNRALERISHVKKSQKIADFISEELLPTNLATPELGIEEVTEDDVVITAYEFKASEIRGSDEMLTLNKALLSLSVARKSFIISNYIESKLPYILGNFVHEIPLTEAFEVLEADFSSNDFVLITNFQNKLMSTDVRKLRQALRTINKLHNSKILAHFLILGRVDPSLLPAENWPAGLDNIGNTCYLNSLLQYYFSVKPIRDMVLGFEESEAPTSQVQKRKIGGRHIEADETKRANQFIYHLQKLFDEMIHTNKRCVQPSKDLAFLSFLPASQPVNFVHYKEGKENNPILIDSDGSSVDMQVDKTPSDMNTLIDLESTNTQASDSVPPEFEDQEVKQDLGDIQMKDDSSIEEIENPFHSPPTPDNETNSKILTINADEMESTIDIGRQQDVTECIENVNFQIETALEPETIEDDGEQFDLIKKLFYGKTTQTITPLDKSKKPRTSVERFSSLIVNVSDHPKDIYDALDNYFNAVLVNLEDGMVKKSLTISKLPDILQFQVQRVLFDRERLMAYKSIEPIPFTDKLYVDRYLETEDKELLQKREEVFQWKSKISELEEKKATILQIDDTSKLNVIDSLITTKRYLDSIKDEDQFDIDQGTIDVIESQVESLKQQVTDIDTQLVELGNKISNQFNDYKKVGYSIFAVFIHRGEASYGHYWIYIKDPHQNGIYRKYNDEIVSEVPASEVFNFVHGNTATPYYIAYVKEELEEEYVEPLKRIIKC